MSEGLREKLAFLKCLKIRTCKEMPFAHSELSWVVELGAASERC